MDDALKEAREGGNVIIRQVTSMDRKLDVREGIKNTWVLWKQLFRYGNFYFSYINVSIN